MMGRIEARRKERRRSDHIKENRDRFRIDEDRERSRGERRYVKKFLLNWKSESHTTLYSLILLFYIIIITYLMVEY